MEEHIMAAVKLLVAALALATLAGCRGCGQVPPPPTAVAPQPTTAVRAQAGPSASPHFIIIFAEADPEVGPAPLSVQFSVFEPPQQDIEDPRYDWDFGDGSPHSSKKSPTHVYERPGNYTVYLKVTDATGADDDDDVDIQVQEPGAP
jgi:hypothetical protein